MKPIEADGGGRDAKLPKKIESESSEQQSSEEADELGSEQLLQGKTWSKAGVEVRKQNLFS